MCPRCARTVPGNERVTNRGADMARRLGGGGLYGPRLAKLLRLMVQAPVSEADIAEDVRGDFERLRAAKAIERRDGRWAPAVLCAQCRDKVLKVLMPYECPLCGHLADPRAAESQHAANLRSVLERYPIARRILSRFAEGYAWGTKRSKWYLPGWSPSLADLQRVSREDGATVEGAVRQLVALRLITEARGQAFRLSPIPCVTCLSEGAEEREPSGGREAIPPQLRFRVLQRDGFRCRYCGRGTAEGATLQLDHVVPVAAGGETTEANLMTACAECNAGKSAHEVVGR